MALQVQAVLTANTSQFNAAMQGAANKSRAVVGSMSAGAGKLGEVMGAVGLPVGPGAAVQVLAQAIQAAWTNADKFVTMGERFGTSADFMRRLSFASEQAGTSLEAATGAMAKLARSASAAPENEKMAEAFAKLGISVEELEGKSPEQLFRMVGTAMRDAAGDAEMMAAAQAVLGRGSAELIPLMHDLNNGLDAAPAAAFFDFFSGEIEALGDNLKAVWDAIVTVVGAVLGSIAAVLNPIFKAIKWIAAYMGALAGGAGMFEAADIASDQVVAEDEAKARGKRAKRLGGVGAGDDLFDEDGNEIEFGGKGGKKKKKKDAEQALTVPDAIAGTSKLGLHSGVNLLGMETDRRRKEFNEAMVEIRGVNAGIKNLGGK